MGRGRGRLRCGHHTCEGFLLRLLASSTTMSAPGSYRECMRSGKGFRNNFDVCKAAWKWQNNGNASSAVDRSGVRGVAVPELVSTFQRASPRELAFLNQHFPVDLREYVDETEQCQLRDHEIDAEIATFEL